MPRLIDHDARRAEIAAAAWRVILREGVTGASVRTVAAEAGLSSGSLRHVFATQSALLVYAFQLVLERATARIAALPPQQDPRRTAEAVAHELLPLDRERRTEMEVYLALFTAAGSTPALQATRDEALRQVRDACRWIVDLLSTGAEESGAEQPGVEQPGVEKPGVDQPGADLAAAHLHAVIDGLAAHLVWMPADADTGWAQDVVDQHLSSLGARET